MHTVTMNPPQLESFRGELLAYCYRMLGSVHEAQDLVQETYLRAWRSRDTFQGRASVRTYLYRIATNVCLTALQQRARRAMPSDLSASDQQWLQPIPDALLSTGTDPADVLQARTGIRFAFIAALQHLSPIRRAALILRDVLSWPAAEVAEALNTTPAAVNSALLRARTQIAQVAPIVETVVEPAEPHRRALLDRYVAAFADADITALVHLLRADIAVEMPPEPQWLRGRTAVAQFFADHVLSTPGEFRMATTMANGQPAFLAHRRAHDGTYRPHAVHVLALDTSGVAHIAVFREPAVCALFTR
ncbi:RNA polymerase subunit sigma-70 [Actinoplanes sp. KI2]|uniref:RNA polymerase subunit sigma-70 n=1 Tax=Actinoplanes sp. KI2 TaxID=2983315 RepID=UPI0021D5E23D|nr:RNA polymerase subunit sigma-70 [Actinoplanes sp. KI2]MCU7727892.1 RNA polymerase subunit sigma-70 [Actinoplanes sp. KI2]